MEKQEFFLLLPAIVYGVAVVDLLKIFRHKNSYWEMIAWGAYMMVYIVLVWLELWSKLGVVATNKWFFILMIGHAILVAQSVSVITPEEKDFETHDYFNKIRVKFFGLLVLIVILNLVIQQFFYDDERPLIFRLILLIFFAMAMFIDRVWVRTMVLISTGALLIYAIVNLT